MGAAALIGPIMSLAGSAGGGKGGGQASAGGISPEQAALAEYQAMQQKLKVAWEFGGGNPGGQGTGLSTMKTQAMAGANTGLAMTMAGMSDATAQQQNQLAQLAQQNNQFNQGYNNPPSGSTSSGNTGTFNSPSNAPTTDPNASVTV